MYFISLLQHETHRMDLTVRIVHWTAKPMHTHTTTRHQAIIVRWHQSNQSEKKERRRRSGRRRREKKIVIHELRSCRSWTAFCCRNNLLEMICGWWSYGRCSMTLITISVTNANMRVLCMCAGRVMSKCVLANVDLSIISLFAIHEPYGFCVTRWH